MNEKRTIAIAATFTAEPVAESLDFWMQSLGLATQIEFAPYSQVFQQLLDPASLLSQNRPGVNTVLVRFEDWQRDRVDSVDTPASLHEKVERNVRDLILALKAAAEGSSTPYLVCICPASPTANLNQAAFFSQMEVLMISELNPTPGVYLTTTADLATAYPVTTYNDPQADQLGHIPYTPLFFAALGTALARKVYAIQSPPYKVIVLDCDLTLWKGVCGEDGALGIEIDPPRRALQEFILTQHSAGMLICLCSKNVEEDVVEVLERHPDMLLKREHLVTWRINWQPKSENIKSLAQELNLGLDSFIFIDDNPVECSEVQANCPEVLTLLLPQEIENIPRFLDHVWAFDHLKTTEADRTRTTLYKQNIERDRSRSEATTFSDFLASLELQIQISALEPQQLSRVAQLTQRTNQFNATTRRWSEAEIQQSQSQGVECLVVEVRDRFGDYGLVGTILFEGVANVLRVNTFLLSCRVLGRGVEHQMLAKLGQIAVAQGLERVDIDFIPSKKNQPVRDFLEGVAGSFKQPRSESTCFQCPASFLSSLTYTPATTEPEPSTPKSVPSGPTLLHLATRTERINWLTRIATELFQPEQILEAVAGRSRQLRPQLSQTFVAPRTTTENQLAQIWSQVLRVDQVGIHDNFFDLGGSSLLAVGIFTQIEQQFGRNLPITTLLEAPTVEQLADIVEREEAAVPWTPLVAIQPQGSRKPLFFVHGGFGDVLGLVTLARHLSPDQPIYGLRGVGLDGIEACLTSVEAMAARYVAEIQAVQPKGPYQLGGQCWGGTVAFEMAQQLQALGQEVHLLALLDTSHPQLENYFRTHSHYYYGRKPPLRWHKRDRYFYVSHLFYYLHGLRHHQRELAKLRPKARLGYLRNFFQQEGFSAIRTLGARLSEGVGSAQVRSAGMTVSPLERQAWIKDQFFETFLRALQVYVPQPYAGQIDFFLPTLTSYLPTAYPSQPQSLLFNRKSITSTSELLFGWDKVALGGLKVHSFASEHRSMMEEPQIQALAEQLTACLEAIAIQADASDTFLVKSHA